MRTSTRTLGLAATAALAVFPVVVVLLNLIQRPDYSARSQAMSELALGRGGSLMGIAFMAMGAGTALLAVALHRTFPCARVTPAALVVAGVLDVFSAVFHTNAENSPATPASNIHNSAGITTFVLVVVAMFASVRHFRRSETWHRYAVTTLVWAIVAFATFFLVPILGSASFGIAQRVFVVTWLSWMLVTAARIVRLEPRYTSLETQAATEGAAARG